MKIFSVLFPGSYPGRRALAVLCGVLAQGFSVALLVLADLGTDPFTTVCLGLADHTGQLLGSVELVINAVMLCAVFALGRRSIGVGTVANMVLVGYTADLCAWVFRAAGISAPVLMWQRVLLMLVGLLIFAPGAALYMTASLGSSPYDAFPFVITERWGNGHFRTVRIAWDTAWVAAGLLLDAPVGPVTFGIMLAMGPVVAAVGRWTSRHLYAAQA